MKITRFLAASAIALFGTMSTAQAAIIFAYDLTSSTDQRLISFNSATPGTINTNVALTGLAPASQTAGAETLIGIDFRPANGLLYGYAGDGGLNGRVVVIDPATGAVTSVAAGTSLAPNGIRQGFDFNPTADRIRTLTDANESRRYNPNDGTNAATDTPLAYGAGDANFGANPEIDAAAYTNNVAGTLLTTLFAIDSNLDILVRVGGVDGAPSPNGGALTTIGALGINLSNVNGFDIDGSTGIAHLSARVGSITNLYTVNLNSGAATLVGAIGNGSAVYNGLSVQPDEPASGVPEPSTFALTLGAAALLYFKRRR